MGISAEQQEELNHKDYKVSVIGQVPDSCVVEALPGETVYKKWFFKNTGKTSWP